ncbi:MAG: hypothetical protein AAF264_02975 [Pseudomonadota bacterium]
MNPERVLDPHSTIRQWILDMRLAGGVVGEREVFRARRSVRALAEPFCMIDRQTSNRVFFEMGLRYLTAYMLAMANAPDISFEAEDVERHLTQTWLAALCERQPKGGVRRELQRAASCDDRFFQCAMLATGVVL